MARINIGVWAAGIFFLCAIDAAATTTSSSCMTAFNDGGAPAVLQDSECADSQWVSIVESLKKPTKNCQFASLQGHREYQEDRVTCKSDIRIPYIGKDAVKEAKLDLLSIFDGHGGAEASQTAKEHVLDYFLVHVVAGAFKKSSNDKNPQDLVGSNGSLPEIDSECLREILKEALIGAIRDTDQKFSSDAFRERYSAGSTACVVLFLNNEELLVANVGDSKVVLCTGDSTSMVSAEELTSDHHPDREDERARIERAGGFVVDWDGPRVNGILAVSRAIGDVFLKRFGLISEPEMTGWRRVSNKDRYLVVASDGIFEFSTPENVCQVLKENETLDVRFPILPSYSLAYDIVKSALEKGSRDNLSAIVVPLVEAVIDTVDSKDEL